MKRIMFTGSHKTIISFTIIFVLLTVLAPGISIAKMNNGRAIFVKDSILVLDAGTKSSPLVKGYKQLSPSINEKYSRTNMLKLWYNKPAPNSNEGWIDRSIPLGNGYMGANVFGGAKTDRIQITQSSLSGGYIYDSSDRIGGLNNFAEIRIDFNHNWDEVTNYKRDLILNTGLAHTQYNYHGVRYKREYFTSYPDKVMAIRLTASKKGELSFTLRPTIPYLNDYRTQPGDHYGKSGTVRAKGNTITLSGKMKYYGIKYEGQLKVIPDGGTIKSHNDKNDSHGTITVSGANSAVILIAVGTNYQFNSQVISASRTHKLDGFPDPHAKVTQMIHKASAKSYKELLNSHLKDYQELYSRVNFNLDVSEPGIPTDKLVDAYRHGHESKYLEELLFQYGRYLLICSSRDNTLPPNLQGKWNVYQNPPWGAGYWHNINLEMNYWPAFTTNMPELFKSYIDYYKTYLPRAREYATHYIKKYHPSQLDSNGNNGWALGNSSFPYNPAGKSAHSGFGTGAFTCMLFWDYYDYTRDKRALKDVAYPAIFGMANFLSRFVQNINGYYLAKPSSSPENASSLQTIGTTFDQQNIYENARNTLKAANFLGYSNDILDKLKKQLPLYDPIIVGKSGQIKEYRQEEYYGDIGEYHHRHISQLLGLYPGQLINTSTPAWLDAAKVSLKKRGPGGTGWAEAQRISAWARIQESKKAYYYYHYWINHHVMHNLWNNHRDSHSNKLFQVDGNFGATAGVAEMLLQSEEYVIEPLPALPDEWANGSYRGLLARGGFEVSASWSNSQADQFKIHSKEGGIAKVRYPNIKYVKVMTSDGQKVSFNVKNRNQISFETTKGETYIITNIRSHNNISNPSKLKKKYNSSNSLILNWTASKDAVSYNVYRAVKNGPTYELLASHVQGASYTYKSEDLKTAKHITFKVTAVGTKGQESDGVTTIMLQPKKPKNVRGYITNDTTLQVRFDEIDKAKGYKVFKKVGDHYKLVSNSPYNVIIIDNFSPEARYAISAAFPARESTKTPVKIKTAIDNVLLNKPVTASKKAHDKSYSYDKMVDGDRSTRMATHDCSTIPCSVTATINLKGSYTLDDLTIYEWKGAEGTRSDDTTVQLYRDKDWHTVIDKRSLNTNEEKKTNFDFQNDIASKMRITWVNTDSPKGSTIAEVVATGTVLNYVDKTVLYNTLIWANKLDTTSWNSAAIITFKQEKQDAVKVLKNIAASQAEVHTALDNLKKSIMSSSH